MDYNSRYTGEEVDERLALAETALQEQAQADWDQTDETAPDYIKNKPDIESADVFIAKYGVTTYAEISAATYNKTIFLDRYGQVFTFIRTDVIRGHCFAAFGGAIRSSSGQEEAALYGELCYVTRGDVWSHTTYTLLGDKDIVTSLDAQSTDQQIPGAKTVYDAIRAAEGGGDVVKYVQQSLTDAQKAQARTNIGAGTYSKPSGGIPDTDLAAAVRTSLGKADSAVQPAALEDVTDLIPAAATPQNQLADKAFVNSSVATNTANYISDNGQPFASLADLQAYSGPLTNNDYAFVVGTDAEGNTTYTRYKYNASTQEWAEEYVLNNSSFTAAQWAAISSGITSADVQKIASAVLVTSQSLTTTQKTQARSNIGAGTYSKASDGIPASDLASAVQTSLGKADTAYQKPSGGIPASDLASGVIPTVPTISTNIASDKTSDTMTAAPKAVYDEVHPAPGTSEPSGGFLPNVVYNLGTITGSRSFAMAAAVTGIVNHYYWTFDTGSTAPTITWPAAITAWNGGSAPTINANKHYEISVLNGIGAYMEV